jgi:hypothetical protein
MAQVETPECDVSRLSPRVADRAQLRLGRQIDLSVGRGQTPLGRRTPERLDATPILCSDFRFRLCQVDGLGRIDAPVVQPLLRFARLWI